MEFCSNCGAELDAEATLCSKCGKKVDNKTFSSEPMSEDDCPEGFPIASAPGRGINGENIAFNYIKEKEGDDYRPLNVQHPYRGGENRNCQRDIKTAKEQKMYAKKTEQGDILLSPSEFVRKIGPGGLMFSHVTLSRMGCTIRWFMDFLTGKEGTPAECESGDKKYHVCRESNAIYLEEIRGNHTNSVAFSLREIPEVLEEIHQIMAEGSTKEM